MFPRCTSLPDRSINVEEPDSSSLVYFLVMQATEYTQWCFWRKAFRPKAEFLAAILELANTGHWAKLEAFWTFSRTWAECLQWDKHQWNKGRSPAFFLSVDKMTNWLIPCNGCLLYDWFQLTETGYPKRTQDTYIHISHLWLFVPPNTVVHFTIQDYCQCRINNKKRKHAKLGIWNWYNI